MIIGIDPGKTGGIAICGDGGQIVAYPMPATDGDIVDFFSTKLPELTIPGQKKICYLEKVGGFTGGRKVPVQCPHCSRTFYRLTGDTGAAMFKFGDNYGFIRAAIMTMRIPIHLITPQQWIKKLQLGTKSSLKTPNMKAHQLKTKWKNKLKEKAQQLYPNTKVTLPVADALLIMHYGILDNKLPF